MVAEMCVCVPLCVGVVGSAVQCVQVYASGCMSLCVLLLCVCIWICITLEVCDCVPAFWCVLG